jgi:hypothetical protein
MRLAMRKSDKESDALRLEDLCRQHGLTCRRVRSTYFFEDFTAHGLRQAVGYVEGYDQCQEHHGRGWPVLVRRNLKKS